MNRSSLDTQTSAWTAPFCTPAWYVIQTKPRKEEEATTYLTAKGLEIFTPRMEYVTSKNGRMIAESRPLFPGYIFGRFDYSNDYSLVKWGRGVKRILSFGSGPTAMDEEVIDTIRKRTDARGVVRKACRFEENDLVRVNSGPMKDLLGIFERWVSDTERVRILLNLVGYRPNVELHYSMVEKVA
jgi:transcriptional antiterminator RfaH